MRARLAVAIGTVVFLVLTGTGISFAYWSTSASTSGTVAAADLASSNCSPAVKIVNGGFESPNIGTNAYQQLPPAGTPPVPGWLVLNDTVVEIWRSQLGSTPPEGAQIAELNGMGFGTLYQDVATTPGQTLRWSLVHRGREGTDTMRVDLGAPAGPAVTQEQWSTSNAAFVRHSGAYVVPAGQTTTRLSLVPVATHNNQLSIGNLIDDISFGTGPCLLVTPTISNITTVGSSTYRVGETVQYTTTVQNVGGASATPSTISAVIPANLTYVAGSLVVDGVARTDAAGDDVAGYTVGTTTVSARLGTGATAAAGGLLIPNQSTTFTFRATIGSGAAGGNLSYSVTAASADQATPTWPISTTSTLTTAVAPAADLAMSVIAPSPNATAGSKQWQFRVTNNGPGTAVAATVAVTIPTNLTGTATVVRSATSAGGATTNCTPASGATRSCVVGDLASGDSRIITITGTIPASPTGLYPASATGSTSTVDLVSANNTAVNNAVDVTAPAAPGTPTTSAPGATSVTLTWTAPSDNVGVTGYRIFANGSQVATSTTNTAPITGLTAGQPYYFWVQAVDAAGNVSAASGGAPFITTLGTGRYLVNYVNGGLCVGAANDNEDAQVQVLTCDSASQNQRWQFVVSGGGYIVSPQVGATRDWRVTSNSTADGTKIFADETQTSRKTWTLFVDWDATAQQAYLGIRRTDATTLCFDVNGASTTAGTQLQQWTCNASAAQRFRLTAAP